MELDRYRTHLELATLTRAIFPLTNVKARLLKESVSLPVDGRRSLVCVCWRNVGKSFPKPSFTSHRRYMLIASLPRPKKTKTVRPTAS